MLVEHVEPVVVTGRHLVGDPAQVPLELGERAGQLLPLLEQIGLGHRSLGGRGPVPVSGDSPALPPFSLRPDRTRPGDRSRRPARLAQRLQEPRSLAGRLVVLGHRQHPMQVAELPPPACPLGSSFSGGPCVATTSGPFFAFCCSEAFGLAVWMPCVDPVPPRTTLPCPGAVPAAAGLEALFAGLLFPLLLWLDAVVAVVSVGADAVVVVPGACAATVCVFPLSFLPISTPSSNMTPSRAIARIANAGVHCWTGAAAAGAAPFAVGWALDSR